MVGSAQPRDSYPMIRIATSSSAPKIISSSVVIPKRPWISA